MSSRGERCTPALGLVSTKGSARRESQAYGPWDKSGQQMCCFGLRDVFKDLNQQQQKKLVDITLKSAYLSSLGKEESLAPWLCIPPATISWS